MATARTVSASAPELSLLLLLLDEAFDKKAWHGPNLKGALRGVSAQKAAWRPAPDRHSIWDVALHAAYWKYAVRRRLTSEKRGSFNLAGSNWFRQPQQPDEAEWKRHLALLTAEHRALRSVVASLELPARGTERDSKLLQIRGAASHDLYHAGQIQLLKRLCPLE